MGKKFAELQFTHIEHYTEEELYYMFMSHFQEAAMEFEDKYEELLE